MKPRVVQLAEVMTIDRAAASEAECRTLPYVGLEHIEKDAGHFNTDFRRKPETLLATKYLFTPRHVLYGKLRPNLNKVALPDFDGVCTTEIFPLLPEPKALDRGFLYAVLLSQQFVKWASNSVSGANLPRLDPERLREYEFDLPDLSEQRRIVGQLEQADRLRRTRRYALELTDTFLPAAFRELFGDPVANPGGWERATVADLGDVETGNTPPRENAEYYGDAIEWIKSDNISLAQVQPTQATEGLSEKGIAVGRIVDTGSLLLTCIAGSETSIGNVVLTDRRVAFNQQINAVTPHRGVDPRFLYGLFVTAKPMLQRSTTLAMKRMITKGKLEQLVLIEPPLPLQQRFSAVVERVERLRAVQREALRQAEHLFASLLDRAFSG